MLVLVLGSGGREHALAWKLSQECDVVVAPGNGGIAQSLPCEPCALADGASVLELCNRLRPDLIVVGPENPLIDGLADQLRNHGFLVLGPGKAGAQLEGSKAFSKQAMVESGVPTSSYRSFQDAEEAIRYAKSRFDADHQVVVKASGPALGKGVTVCGSFGEAEEAIHQIMVESEYGDAGMTVVIEDRLFGREFSLLTLVSGKSIRSLPVAQDYKRLLDGGKGPNTGGMGSHCPVPWLTQEIYETAESVVVRPIVDWMHNKGIDFRGVLFSGLMVQEGLPYCLEYNVRFGDPETQSIVRRVGSGFLHTLLATAKGEPIPDFEHLQQPVVTVVAASHGYPGAVEKGATISLEHMPDEVVLFYAGTQLHEGKLVTSGGRVLAVSATGESFVDARAKAYQGLHAIHFTGKQYRTDIADV